MMTKIQGEGLENKGGVNEGPTTPRPAPPKGHAPEANSEGRAEPGQVEWPPPSVETSGLRPPAPNSRAGQGWGRLAKYYIDNDTIKSFGKPGDPTRPHHCIFADWRYGGGGIGCMHSSRSKDTLCLPENCPFVKMPQPDQAEPPKDIPEDPGHDAVRGRPAEVEGGQVETGMEDKPLLSDEELGYSLQRWLLDEGLAEIALTAEEAGWYGAAIRARLERK